MPKIFTEMTSELKFELLGIGFATMGLLGIISLMGYNAGPIGSAIAKILRYAFGVGSPVIPLGLIIVGLKYIWMRSRITYSLRFLGIVVLYFLSLAIFHHVRIPVGEEVLPESLLLGGGLSGGMILFTIRKLLGFYGSLIVLVAASVCAFIVATTWSLAQGFVLAKQKASEGLTSAREALSCTLEDNTEKSPVFYNQEQETTPIIRKIKTVELPGKLALEPEANPIEPFIPKNSAYTVPPLSILRKSIKPRYLKMSKEIADNTRVLEETLKDFNVSAKVVHTSQGPTVTRYELEPAPGVKVSRIVNLSDDITLKLATSGVRIEAPIPGKAAIGIEVPNKEVSSVPLRDVLESEAFQQASSRLTVALGKDIAGQTVLADLAKMPHLLVAGSTGSGKSVCINTLITSILFKAHPSEVKFVLIDPKMVETF